MGESGDHSRGESTGKEKPSGAPFAVAIFSPSRKSSARSAQLSVFWLTSPEIVTVAVEKSPLNCVRKRKSFR